MALSPSQRIKTIKNLCAKMAVEEWSDIDLALTQFRLPTLDHWSGSKESYLLNAMKGIDDESLAGLAEHYEVDTKLAHHVSHPRFWQPGMFRLFLSHLSTHQAFAGELQENFYRYGISCFVAHKDVEPNTEWQAEIEAALASCDALLALLHTDFHTSKWTDQEIGFAMGRGAPVLSVRLGQDPYGFIGKFQGFNGKGKTVRELCDEVHGALCKDKKTQAAIAEALISAFEKSASFDQTNMLIQRLNELDYWDKSFNDRITAAASSNGQVRDTFNIKRKIAAVLAKHG